MAYTLSNLLLRLMGDLGRVEKSFKATGGSITTAIDTRIGQRAVKQRPKANYAKDYFMFVTRDAGGASAAPEGEFQRITTYNATAFIYTADAAFSAAIAVGDRITLVDNEMFLEDVIQRINDSVQEIDIVVVDASNITVSNQQDYDLPLAAKREQPLKVEIQTVAGDDESYKERLDYIYIPSVAGSVGTLHFLQNNLVASMTMRITYKTYHPAVWVYNSVFHQTVSKDLIIAKSKVAVLEWYCNLNEDKEYWAQQLNIARSDLDNVTKNNRTWMPDSPGKQLWPV